MLRSRSAEFGSKLLEDFSQSAAELSHSLKQRARAKVVWYFDAPADVRRKHILTAYRVNHSFYESIRSLFELHNETLNVWTHILGCVFFVACLVHCASEGIEEGLPPESGRLERWPLYVFIGSALICLGNSAVYHLWGTANERWYAKLANLDYAGIVALIVGSCCPVVHFGFGPTHSQTRAMYMLGILALGVLVLVCSLSRWFDKYERTRICLFVSLGLSGVVALLHAMIAHDFSPATTSLFLGVAQMGATYLTGVSFYATHFPEVSWPKRFDIVGSSHQLWHACVLLAAFFHFQTVLALWRSSALELHALGLTERTISLTEHALGAVAATYAE